MAVIHTLGDHQEGSGEMGIDKLDLAVLPRVRVQETHRLPDVAAVYMPGMPGKLMDYMVLPGEWQECLGNGAGRCLSSHTSSKRGYP